MLVLETSVVTYSNLHNSLSFISSRPPSMVKRLVAAQPFVNLACVCGLRSPHRASPCAVYIMVFCVLLLL